MIWKKNGKVIQGQKGNNQKIIRMVFRIIVKIRMVMTIIIKKNNTIVMGISMINKISNFISKNRIIIIITQKHQHYM